jgi:hypothetical protein
MTSIRLASLLHVVLGATLVGMSCSTSATSVEGGTGFSTTGEVGVGTGLSTGGAEVGAAVTSAGGGNIGVGVGVGGAGGAAPLLSLQGTFDCVQSTDGPASQAGAGGAGLDVSVTVKDVGGMLFVSFPGFMGTPTEATFAPDTGSSATLPLTFGLSGFQGACAADGGVEAYPAVLATPEGELAVQGNTLLISFEGTVEPNPSAPPTSCPFAPGGAFVVCTMAGGGPITAPKEPPDFAMQGTYQCDATSIQRTASNTATSVDHGTVVIGQPNGVVTASPTLEGGSLLGTLQLVTLTSRTALLLPDPSGHAASVPCTAANTAIPRAPLATVAGTLEVLGEAIHLTVRGTVAECGGADHVVDLRCTAMAGQ